MDKKLRNLFPYVAAAMAVAAVVWAVSYKPIPPADFTFSNGTEIKSIDPAIVTGQPEGCIIRGLFEGLVDWDPKDLHPIPGTAQSWDISEDGRTYTFNLRKNANWSDGSAVVAHDYVYSMRRFLDPMTGAEYAFIMHYIKNAAQYNRGEVESGDAVEVELLEREENARPFARGKILKGTLKTVDEKKLDEKRTTRRWEVEIDGTRRTFATNPDAWNSESIEPCGQVLLDFDEVAFRATDDHTIVIELNDPVPYFLNLMGFYPVYPVNQRCVETHGYPAWTKPENLVTNGPFTLDFRNVRDRIRMKKNPHYWDRDNVHFNFVDAMAVESNTTELNLYMAGKVDWIRTVPTTIIPELLKQNRDDFDPQPYLSIYYYRINTTKKPLDKPAVRKALALAIDKEEIVQKITQAGEIPAYRIVPPNLTDYDHKKATHASEVAAIELRFDPQRAKELMAEAGFPGGKGFPTIQLLYNTNEGHQAIAESVQAKWKEVLGIDVELINKEWGSYLADQRQMSYFIARAGWIGDYTDPNTFLDLFVTDGPQNKTGWGKVEYDSLIEKSAAVRISDEDIAAIEKRLRERPDHREENHKKLLKDALLAAIQEKRMSNFFDAEQLLLDDMPVIPVYYYVSKAVVRPYLKGFYQNIQDTHPFKGMSIDQDVRRRYWESKGPK